MPEKGRLRRPVAAGNQGWRPTDRGPSGRLAEQHVRSVIGEQTPAELSGHGPRKVEHTYAGKGPWWGGHGAILRMRR
jgi:hypothetical protein